MNKLVESWFEKLWEKSEVKRKCIDLQNKIVSMQTDTRRYVPSTVIAGSYDQKIFQSMEALNFSLLGGAPRHNRVQRSQFKDF